MKFPVSREKFETLLQEHTDVKQQLLANTTALETMTSELEAKTSELAIANKLLEESDANALVLANEELTTSLETLTTQLEAKVAEIDTSQQKNVELQNALDLAQAEKVTLEETIATLTNRPIDDPAQVIAQQDGHGEFDLNEFITKNQEDTEACIAAIKESGLAQRK